MKSGMSSKEMIANLYAEILSGSDDGMWSVRGKAVLACHNLTEFCRYRTRILVVDEDGETHQLNFYPVYICGNRKLNLELCGRAMVKEREPEHAYQRHFWKENSVKIEVVRGEDENGKWERVFFHLPKRRK
jgi:hypothetical protein